MLLFSRKLFPSGRSQFVIARFAIVIRSAPLGLDPALCFQTIKRRIKRTLLDTQNVFRYLVNPISNGQPMPRLVLQCFQDQHVERAVNEIWFVLGHVCAHPDCLGNAKSLSLHLDCQDELPRKPGSAPSSLLTFEG